MRAHPARRLVALFGGLVLALAVSGSGAALAAGDAGAASSKELERLERQLQREGKMTKRIRLPGPAPAAERDECREAGGPCWRTVRCIGLWCLCVAERDCLERDRRDVK